MNNDGLNGMFEDLKTKEERKTFAIFDTALACVVFILLNFIFSCGYSLIPTGVRSNIAVQIIAQFLVEFLFAVAAWLVSMIGRVDCVVGAGMKKKVSGKIVLYGFLIALVLILFLSSLTDSFSEFLGLLGYTSSGSSIVIDNFWKYLAYTFVLCVAPALFEELLFRGVIMSGLKGYGKMISIIISALIFMLMHGSPDQTVHQFILGIVIGIIFYETGNLWIGVIIHFFNNFITITLSFLYTVAQSQIDEIYETATENATELSPWLSWFIGLVLAVICAAVGVWLLKKLIKSAKAEDKKLNGENKNMNSADERTAQVLIDGVEIETTALVQGEPEKDKTLNEEDLKKAKKQNKEMMPISCIVMFALSGLYLVLMWILELVSGF